MKKSGCLVVLVLVVVVAAGGYWLAGRHFVQTTNGMVVMDKRFMTLKETFVDVRAWKSEDFDAHPDIKRALNEHGYRDLLVQIKTEETKAEAAKVLQDAKDKAAEITKRAQADASAVVTQAAARAESLVKDIDQKAQTWVADGEKPASGRLVPLPVQAASNTSEDVSVSVTNKVQPLLGQ
jgi:hypothetical protein